MTRRRIRVLGVWLITLAVAGLIISRTTFLNDMSAFLPQRPTPAQRVLVDNLRDGVASRLLLVAVAGVSAERQGDFSRALAGAWRAGGHFLGVNNGDLEGLQADQALLFDRRYQLSPGVSRERFQVAALRESLQNTVTLLSSSTGVFAKEWLLRDPTAETLRILENLPAGQSPRLRDGVWISADAAKVMLLLYTRAAGGELDALELAIADAKSRFDEVRKASRLDGATLAISGPAKFAVESRESIRGDVTRLSLLGAGLILGLLIWAFRSVRPIALALVPILSAVVVATATVAMGFGSVHGLTLGFGTTLIGEAVDYALYHLGRSASTSPVPAREFWATIRVGVFTSIAGFGALLFSGFPGLAQLAVFSIAGLITAVLVTRWVLPELDSGAAPTRDLARLEARATAALRGARQLRWPLLVLVAAAAVVVVTRHDRLWDPDIASLNPISRAAQQLDEELRATLGAPDARVMIVVQAPAEAQALQGAHDVGIRLGEWVRDGRLAGFESPASILPPPDLQRARQAALPDEQTLWQSLREAATGLPLRVERLDRFVADVQTARTRPPVTLADLEGTQIGVRVRSLLTRHEDHWAAILALRAPPGAALDPARMAAELPQLGGATVTVLDLKAQTDQLYAGYLREAGLLALGGGLAVVMLLAFALRSARAVLVVCAPLAGAVVLIVGAYAAIGRPMNLLHLVGLMLVVAVGSNYALFIHSLRSGALSRAPSSGTMGSLVLANVSTLIGFGVLAFSGVPLLSALGATVGSGCALALLLSGAWIH